MGQLKGKVALITGSSRGIGRAMALRFASEGATVAVHYGKNADAAHEVVRAIESDGGRAIAVGADLASVAAIAAMFGELDEKLTALTGSNTLDILVNNAGVSESIELEATTEAQFDALFDTNVKGLFFVTQNALPRLRDGGRIINVTSVASRTAVPGILAYAMTKGAVDVLTHHLASAVGARGITVNGVAPGAINTDMNEWMRSAEGEQSVLGLQALQRVGQPEDIANAAMLLASDDASWITANYINASGGSKL